MAAVPPSYSFVAFPPCADAGQVLFGKNSARPRDEVQEVVYVPAATHPPESEVQCTYVTVAQAPRTHAVMLSKPAWMWGAEMGANEHGVCIASEAVITKDATPDTDALLGPDLARLGLERSVSAKDALDIIVSLLEKHSQGGNYFEDGRTCHACQSTFLIVDKVEAWVLETTGKYWAAEKITEGARCVCNHLQLTTKMDAEHPEMRDYALSNDWWDGETDFNFSKVFSADKEHMGSCMLPELLDTPAVVVRPRSLTPKTSFCLDMHSDYTFSLLKGILTNTAAVLAQGALRDSQGSRCLLPASIGSLGEHLEILWFCDHNHGVYGRSCSHWLGQAGPVTAQTMIDVLRENGSGPCTDSESFIVPSSMVSVLARNENPCIHFFTGTPDPSRSIFKPFIFVEDVKPVPKVCSPFLGNDDPAKSVPRFQEIPDRRHMLYKAHEWARSVIGEEEQGEELLSTMMALEKQGLEAMEDILVSSKPLNPAEVVDLFYDCVDTEIKFYK